MPDQTTFTPTMSVGDYTISEIARPAGAYQVLRVAAHGADLVTVVIALPVPGSAGRITWGTMSTDHPDLAEACALALDRAATILRDARLLNHDHDA